MTMRSRTLGQSDREACPVALGTWAVGGGKWWGETDDEESIRAIRTALDHGINLVDTAPIYGFGRSEEVVGKAIAGRREEVVLATKCGLWWHDDRGAPWFELEGRSIRRCLRPETIREEVDMSLKRLGVETIDLYQTHWQTLEADPVPVAETMGCLLELKAAGKIRAIGASNVDVPQVEEYRAAGPLDAIQPRYSMLDRAIEVDLLPHCEKTGVSVLAYSPLEQGLLAGKFGMDYEPDEGEARGNIPWMEKENRARVLAMLEGWKDLLAKYDCTYAQLVIAWTVSQPGLTYALCGARKEKHARDNAGAAALELDPADLTRMRRDVEALGEPTGCAGQH